MSGSVGRLKAVVEIVGKEVVRELRKNKFFNYLEDKGKIGDRTIVLQFILVKRFVRLFVCCCFFFFQERCNRSSFENFRKAPEERGELTRAVREGSRVSRHSTSV